MESKIPNHWMQKDHDEIWILGKTKTKNQVTVHKKVRKPTITDPHNFHDTLRIRFSFTAIVYTNKIKINAKQWRRGSFLDLHEGINKWNGKKMEKHGGGWERWLAKVVTPSDWKPCRAHATRKFSLGQCHRLRQRIRQHAPSHACENLISYRLTRNYPDFPSS